MSKNKNIKKTSGNAPEVESTLSKKDKRLARKRLREHTQSLAEGSEVSASDTEQSVVEEEPGIEMEIQEENSPTNEVQPVPTNRLLKLKKKKNKKQKTTVESLQRDETREEADIRKAAGELSVWDPEYRNEVDAEDPDDELQEAAQKLERSRLRFELQKQNYEDKLRKQADDLLAQKTLKEQHQRSVQVINGGNVKRLTTLENKDIKAFKILVDSAHASHVKNKSSSLVERLRKLVLGLNFSAENNFGAFEKFKVNVLSMLTEFVGDETVNNAENQALYTNMILDKLKTNSGSDGHLAYQLLSETRDTHVGAPISLDALWVKWAIIRNKEVEYSAHHNRWSSRRGPENTYDKTRNERNKNKDAEKRKQDAEKRAPGSSDEVCKSCGKTHGGECRALKYKHPDANYTDLPWEESDAGKLWASHGQSSMVFRTRANGEKLPRGDKEDYKKTNAAGKDFKKKHTQPKMGRPDIKRHKLTQKLNRHLGGDVDEQVEGEVPTHSADHSAHDVTAVFGQPSVPPDHPALCMLYEKEDLLTPENDDDGIVHKVDDYFWELFSDDEEEEGQEKQVNVEPRIEGSEELQAKIRALLKKYDDVLSAELKP
eukprot:gene29850-36970_t